MSVKAIVTKTGEREIRIVREFDAPRERVWRALTEPKLLAQWWGRGHRLDVEKFEARPGGHWRFVEHTPDGERHGFEGRFAEVVPPERIVQTFEWDGAPAHPSLQTSTLEALDGNRTRLVVVTTFLFGADLDAMFVAGAETGMNQSYAALDALLARGLSSPRPSRPSRGSRRKGAPARGSARARRTGRRRSSRT